ncbi:hypothetical protein THIOKS13550001 [Thiocapsa sp. KS1]|nr:hypothetical protein THIOKS13550001 [Thiocapsa sp. KS1]
MTQGVFQVFWSRVSTNDAVAFANVLPVRPVRQLKALSGPAPPRHDIGAGSSRQRGIAVRRRPHAMSTAATTRAVEHIDQDEGITGFEVCRERKQCREGVHSAADHEQPAVETVCGASRNNAASHFDVSKWVPIRISARRDPLGVPAPQRSRSNHRPDP